jgi:hypothetical protein
MQKIIGIYSSRQGFFLVEITKKKKELKILKNSFQKELMLGHVKRFDIRRFFKKKWISSSYSSPLQRTFPFNFPNIPPSKFFSCLIHYLEPFLPFDLKLGSTAYYLSSRGKGIAFTIPQEATSSFRKTDLFKKSDIIIPLDLAYLVLLRTFDFNFQPTAILHQEGQNYHLMFFANNELLISRCCNLATAKNSIQELKKTISNQRYDLKRIFIVSESQEDELKKLSSLLNIEKIEVLSQLIPSKFNIHNSESIIALGIALASYREKDKSNYTSHLPNSKYSKHKKKNNFLLAFSYLLLTLTCYSLVALQTSYLDKEFNLTFENLQNKSLQLPGFKPVHKKEEHISLNEKLNILENYSSQLKKVGSLFPLNNPLLTSSELISEILSYPSLELSNKNNYSDLILEDFHYKLEKFPCLKNPNQIYKVKVFLSIQASLQQARSFYNFLENSSFINKKEALSWQPQGNNFTYTFYLKPKQTHG